MRFLTPVKAYCDDAWRDANRFASCVARPVSHRTAMVILLLAAIAVVVMSITDAYAATPLFEKLKSGAESLLNDAQDMVNTLAKLALIICILGVFIASMMGPKATATMTTALKFVIGFYIFWVLIPVILSTIEQLFGDGSGGTAGD